MKKKQNEGITLVALVITIIVLIILAGVSINAVMNEGLITNAKDAKNEYEEAKKVEKKTLSQLEIDDIEMEFLKKGIPYKYKKGYITGINQGVTVKEVLDNFPENEEYYIYNSNKTEQKKDGDTVANGMILVKGEEKIGTLIIFGDCSGDGSINDTDASIVLMFLANSYDANINTIAMDVNHDEKINVEDYRILLDYSNGEKIEQNEYARDLELLTIENGKYITNLYIGNLKKNYNINDNGENKTYILTNTELEGTSVGTVLNLLPTGAAIYRYDIEKDTEEIFNKGKNTEESEILKSGDEVIYDYNGLTIYLPIYILSINE